MRHSGIISPDELLVAKETMQNPESARNRILPRPRSAPIFTQKAKPFSKVEPQIYVQIMYIFKNIKSLIYWRQEQRWPLTDVSLLCYAMACQSRVKKIYDVQRSNISEILNFADGTTTELDVGNRSDSQ